MKMTINGTEVEGTPDEIAELMRLSTTEEKCEAPKPAGSAYPVPPDPTILDLLTPTQRDTYNRLPSRGVFTVRQAAERLKIKQDAASMRLRALRREGLVERVAFGHYRLVRVV